MSSPPAAAAALDGEATAGQKRQTAQEPEEEEKREEGQEEEDEEKEEEAVAQNTDDDEDDGLSQQRKRKQLRSKTKSRFVEAEAGEDDENDEDGAGGDRSSRKKAKRTLEDDSSDEEDGDVPTEEDQRFVVPDNAMEEEGENRGAPSKREEEEELEDELDEEDLELVRESQLRSKKSRLQKRAKSLHALESDEEAADEGEELESEEDDFIEESEEIQRERIRAAMAGRRDMVRQDSALRELQELFGDEYFGLTGEDKEFPEEEAEAPVPQLADIVEPSILAERMRTQRDAEILVCDMPERLQPHYAVNGEPQLPTVEQLAQEAQWMLNQSPFDERRDRIDLEQAIHDTLVQLRREFHEVQFIYHYRRDFFDGVLTLQDLWSIFDLDQQWRTVLARKSKVLTDYNEMLLHRASTDSDPYLEDQLTVATTDHDSKDVSDYFHLHYQTSKTRMAKQATLYHKARDEPDIVAFAKKYGITSEQFGDNLNRQYRHHEPEDPDLNPTSLAETYVTTVFRTPRHVVLAARALLSLEIATDPLVRRSLRERLKSSASVTVRPTTKGRKEIDRFHEYSDIKYITNKPLRRVEGSFFLRLMKAEKEGYLKISLTSISTANTSLFSELRSLITSSGTSDVANAWNEERTSILKDALDRFLAPMIERDIRTELESESAKYVAEYCQNRLEAMLMVAPYAPAAFPAVPVKPPKVKKRKSRRRSGDDGSDDSDTSGSDEDDEDEESYESSIHDVPQGVLAISWLKDDGTKEVLQSATLGAMLTKHGELRETIRLTNMRMHTTRTLGVPQPKQEDLETLREFIDKYRPAAVVIGTIGLDARNLFRDIESVVGQVRSYTPHVMYVEDDVAVLYSKSPRAKKDFPNLPPLLHYCISLGRRVLDPLNEFCALADRFNNDLPFLKLDPLQDMIPMEVLTMYLERALVNAVAATGVDLNRILPHPHLHAILPYVPGLGFRRAFELLDIASQQRVTELKSRVQLLQQFAMLGTVFDNSMAFFKIVVDETKPPRRRRDAQEGDATAVVDVLDRTRIHRESYVYARRMAADALEKELPEQQLEQSSDVVRELQRMPDVVHRLSMFSLEQLREYACKLKELGDWRRVYTLKMIQHELGTPFSEVRNDFRPPEPAELFDMLTGETDESLHVGLLVTAVVTRVQEARVHVRLDSGLPGEINARNCTDDGMQAPNQIFNVGDIVQGRVLGVNKEKFSVELTTRPKDVLDTRRSALPGKRLDAFYDEAAHQHDLDEEVATERRKAQRRRQRHIAHEFFRDFTFLEAEQHLANAPVGDFILRPSSQGDDYLAVTVKMGPGLFFHVHVRSTDKLHPFDPIGRSLFIDNERFNDIDEVLARYVQPIGMFVNDALQHRKFRNTTAEELEMLVNKEKEASPLAMPYYFCQNPQQPNRLVLVYRTGTKPRQEAISVTPNGYRFRYAVNRRYFSDLNELFNWFKSHYRDFEPKQVTVAMQIH